MPPLRQNALHNEFAGSQRKRSAERHIPKGTPQSVHGMMRTRSSFGSAGCVGAASCVVSSYETILSHLAASAHAADAHGVLEPAPSRGPAAARLPRV
jgi:hypothetical protein